MPIRTAGEYLSRRGFTLRKPLKQTYEQRPVKARKWPDEEYPAVVTRAKKVEGAEIHQGCAATVGMDAVIRPREKLRSFGSRRSGLRRT